MPRTRGRAMRRIAVAAAIATICALVGATRAAAASAPKSFFGVVPQTPLDASALKRMGDANVGTLRIIITWSGIDQSAAAGDEDWSTIDPVVLEAARNGIDVLPFIFGTPDWVAQDLDGQSCSGAKCALYAPKSKQALSAWSAFVGAAVDRYGPGGEFWSEHPERARRTRSTPGRSGTSRTRRASTRRSPIPKHYAKLLTAAATAIHARDQRRGRGPRRHGRAGRLAQGDRGLEVPGEALRRQGGEQELRRRRAAPVRQEHQQGHRPDRPLPRRDQGGPRQEGRLLDHRDRRRLGERRQPAQRRRQGPGEAAEEDLQVLPQAAPEAARGAGRLVQLAGLARRASAPGAGRSGLLSTERRREAVATTTFVKVTGGRPATPGVSRCRRACGGPRWRRGSARTGSRPASPPGPAARRRRRPRPTRSPPSSGP